MRATAALAALVLIAGTAIAREPILEVRFEPETFGVEDAARLVVKVHDPADDVETPDLGALENLQVVAGPSRGHEFSFVNGVSTTTISFSYVVRPEAEGRAAVGPVTVAVGGVKLRKDPLVVEVAPGSLQPARGSRRPSVFGSDPFSEIFGRRSPAQQPMVHLRHMVSPKRVVMGQPVMAVVVLDTTAAVDDFAWNAAPAYPGWWAQRVDPPEQIRPETVEVDGVRYNRFVIARHALIPLRSGELVIPAVSARVGTRTRSFLEPSQVVERSTPEIRVTMTDRPPPPAGYAGAVGALTYGASLEPQRIAFGESAVLTVKLSGTGNLPLVEAPTVWPECPSCDSYPPEEESRISVDDAGIHGSRAWRLTLVPGQWGELELLPVEMTVFDPAAGIYRSQRIGPLALTVDPPPPTPTVPAVTEPAAEDQTEGRNESAGAAGGRGGQWVMLGAALVLGLVLGGLVARVAGRKKRDVIPQAMPDQSPADRARELQLALERWWVERRAKGERRGLRPEMEALRRELEAVRFAPGRADHSETIVDLEQRLRALMRKA